MGTVGRLVPGAIRGSGRLARKSAAAARRPGGDATAVRSADIGDGVPWITRVKG